MLKAAIKFLVGMLFLLPLASKADELTPPALPVFYYGNVIFDGEPALADSLVSVKKLADNTEFGSFSPSEAGKYYYEMACSAIIGESLFFTLDGIVAGETVCPDVMAIPSVNLNLEADSNNPKANQWTSAITFPLNLNPEDEAKINFTPVAAGADNTVTIGASGLIITRDSADPLKRFEIVLTAGTLITGSAAWDGSILAPTTRATSTLSVPDDPGSESIEEEIVEIGFSGESLSFDQPARIFFPGQTGKRVGFSRAGVFTEITNVCPLNNGLSLVGGVNECKFDDGIGLYVWTNHFTLFTVFSSVSLPLPPPEPVRPLSGGSSGSTACAEIKYGEWGECENDFQSREIISKIPSYCELSEEEKNAAKRACVKEEIPENAENDNAENGESDNSGKNNGVVLGEKIYSDGELIRSADRKIYYLENGTRRHVLNLSALKKFRGLMIREVSVFTVNAYPEGEKFRGWGEGDLARDKAGKIYLIKGGKMIHVRSLEELRKNYSGKEIYDL